MRRERQALEKTGGPRKLGRKPVAVSDERVEYYMATGTLTHHLQVAKKKPKRRIVSDAQDGLHECRIKREVAESLQDEHLCCSNVQ